MGVAEFGKFGRTNDVAGQRQLQGACVAMVMYGAVDRQGKVAEAFDHMRLRVWPCELFVRGNVAKIVARREAASGAAQYYDPDRRRLQVGNVEF